MQQQPLGRLFHSGMDCSGQEQFLSINIILSSQVIVQLQVRGADRIIGFGVGLAGGLFLWWPEVGRCLKRWKDLVTDRRHPFLLVEYSVLLDPSI